MRGTQNTSYLLQHLCTVLAKQSDQALQERLDMGLAQFKILRVLQHSPGVRQRRVAEWLGQTEASVSRQIRLMVDKGLLQVTISPKNRREHVTMLTMKGLRLTDEAMKVVQDCQSDVYKDLGAEKQQQLRSILSQMHAIACPAGKSSSCHQTMTYKTSNN